MPGSIGIQLLPPPPTLIQTQAHPATQSLPSPWLPEAILTPALPVLCGGLCMSDPKAWDLPSCPNPSAAPDKLCVRSKRRMGFNLIC